MKKNIVVLILLFLSFVVQGQNIRKIIIHGVSFHQRTPTATTIKNIKSRSYYVLKADYNLLNNVFYDYKSCHKLLISQDTFQPISRDICFAYVDIFFNCRKVTIFFKPTGEYYYKGKWYKANYELFYCIFWYFSDNRIVPNNILKKGEDIINKKNGW
jgi:hypothetical protein